MSSPVVVAWELVSDTHHGFWVCSESHYSIALMHKDRQRIEGREFTLDETVEVYRNVNALSGPYTVSGSKITLHRTASLKGDSIGVDIKAELIIEGIG